MAIITKPLRVDGTAGGGQMVDVVLIEGVHGLDIDDLVSAGSVIL